MAKWRWEFLGRVVASGQLLASGSSPLITRKGQVRSWLARGNTGVQPHGFSWFIASLLWFVGVCLVEWFKGWFWNFQTTWHGAKLWLLVRDPYGLC